MTSADHRGLRAEGIVLARGGRTVLAGAACEVRPGEVTALIAPSGAGKSTLLRCLVRLLEPDAGTITLDGAPLASLDPRVLRRRVGLVSQQPVMLPGTVAANLRHGVDELSDGSLDEALATAGLESAFADRLATELSGGEQARVGIARALTRGPELLLLDEPTAALDHDVADALGTTLRDLAGRGLGVCMAIHDLAFAARFADRGVALDGSPVPLELAR